MKSNHEGTFFFCLQNLMPHFNEILNLKKYRKFNQKVFADLNVLLLHLMKRVDSVNMVIILDLLTSTNCENQNFLFKAPFLQHELQHFGTISNLTRKFQAKNLCGSASISMLPHIPGGFSSYCSFPCRECTATDLDYLLNRTRFV